MDNIKFKFRIKYDSEKAAAELKNEIITALTQLRPINEIRVARTGGAEGGIGAGVADGGSGVGGAGGGGGGSGASILDTAILAAIERFGTLFQWIE